MSCRWVAKDQPRAVVGRHGDECVGDLCRGCQPCTEPHCRVCGITHKDGTCAECLAETRSSLHEIARMCDALPEEVEHRGIDGEAMMLLGPTADPEMRGHLEASVAAGRVRPDYLADAIGETHPVWVLGTWDMLWRDALDHDVAEGVTIAGAVDYLDRTMSYMADFAWLPFEDFARDLRRCVAHMEAVLHDGEQREISLVRCIELDCNAPLARVYGAKQGDDGWMCSSRRCDSRYDPARYARALHEHLASEGAERWVRVAEALSVIPRPEMTLRTWIANGSVRSYRDEATGQVFVWWPDVRQRHVEAQQRRRRPKASPCA